MRSPVVGFGLAARACEMAARCGRLQTADKDILRRWLGQVDDTARAAADEFLRTVTCDPVKAGQRFCAFLDEWQGAKPPAIEYRWQQRADLQ